MSWAPPPRVYETVLYAEDVAAACAFYSDVLGFAPLFGLDGLGGGFRLPGGAVLLIFAPGRSSAPGRGVPGHGARGAGHVAFAVDRGQLAVWRERFAELDIPIEHADEHQLYVRDPAGNSVELVEGEIWSPPPAG